MAQAFAARHGERVKPPGAPGGEQFVGAGRRAGALITGDAIDRRAALTQRGGEQFATAVTAENGHSPTVDRCAGKFRQLKQGFRIETLGRHQAVGNAMRRQGLDRARPDRGRTQAGRPRPLGQNGRYGMVDRIRADENGEAVLRQIGNGRGERRRIGGRRNFEQGEDQRITAGGGNRLGQRRCLRPGPGNNDGSAAKRAGGTHLQWASFSRMASAPWARRVAASCRPSASSSAGLPRNSALTISLPSAVATKPRSHNWPLSMIA